MKLKRPRSQSQIPTKGQCHAGARQDENRPPGKAAERAIQLDGADNYRYLDALAAAHASVGHFDEACSAVTQAIHNAPQDAVLALEARLAQYKSEQPYRQAENDTSLER